MHLPEDILWKGLRNLHKGECILWNPNCTASAATAPWCCISCSRYVLFGARYARQSEQVGSLQLGLDVRLSFWRAAGGHLKPQGKVLALISGGIFFTAVQVSPSVHSRRLHKLNHGKHIGPCAQVSMVTLGVALPDLVTKRVIQHSGSVSCSEIHNVVDKVTGLAMGTDLEHGRLASVHGIDAFLDCLGQGADMSVHGIVNDVDFGHLQMMCT